MVEIVKSATFDCRLRNLKDRRAAARVLVRVDRLAAGIPATPPPSAVGSPSFASNTARANRVYYLQDGDRLILLLCDGHKSSQYRDIKDAHRIADEWKAER